MPTLLVISGPTGVGKTKISLRLAEIFGCPIVSSDSRQIYRELKIGTASPTDEELRRVKHYFIGSHSIFDEYSAGQYETDSVSLLETLFRQHDVVLLVGGSMMYIDAVCKGFDDIPSVDAATREFWQKEFAEKGLEHIQNKLKQFDEKHYAEVDLKNPKRVLHAIEICAVTGKPYSELRTGRIKKRNFDILKIGLNRPRTELYERINRRVDQMVKDGLIEEAREFYQHKALNPLNTVGYKEFYGHWDGKYDMDFAINLLKQDTRRYAKRQMTWYNRDEAITWFHPDNETEIIEFITAIIKKSN